MPKPTCWRLPSAMTNSGPPGEREQKTIIICTYLGGRCGLGRARPALPLFSGSIFSLMNCPVGNNLSHWALVGFLSVLQTGSDDGLAHDIDDDLQASDVCQTDKISAEDQGGFSCYDEEQIWVACRRGAGVGMWDSWSIHLPEASGICRT